MTTFTEEEQRQNLRKLGEYLRDGYVEMKFDMRVICSAGESSYSPFYWPCGNIGNALGHGPVATGINGRYTEKWNDYSMRVFGLEEGQFKERWCFSVLWAYVDNTPEGAGCRILYYLDHGLPKNWHRQLLGSAPLCY